MGFFSSDSRKMVTKSEWAKVRSTLYFTHHFSESLLDRLEEDMRGNMDREYDGYRGVDTYELNKLVIMLREKLVPKDIISSDQVETFEEEMTKYI